VHRFPAAPNFPFGQSVYSQGNVRRKIAGIGFVEKSGWIY
jgi:hypothetical protein